MIISGKISVILDYEDKVAPHSLSLLKDKLNFSMGYGLHAPLQLYFGKTPELEAAEAATHYITTLFSPSERLVTC